MKPYLKRYNPLLYEPPPQLQSKSSAKKYINYALGLILLIVAGYFIFNSIQTAEKTSEETLTNNNTTNTLKEPTEENGTTAEKPYGQQAEIFQDKLKRIVKDCPELFKNTMGDQINFRSRERGYELCCIYFEYQNIRIYRKLHISSVLPRAESSEIYQSMLSTGTDSVEILEKFREYRTKIQHAFPDFKDGSASVAAKSLI